MNGEQLLDVLGQLDDDLILEAEETPVRRKFPLWQAATAAAAAVVICAGAYLLPAMQPADVAAPESQRTDSKEFMTDVADDVFDVAGGTNDEYKYVTDQSAARAPLAGEKESAGVFEPVFCTEQGRYVLVGEAFPLKSKLPDDVRYLGELTLTAPGKQVYPCVGTEELVGCPVWQSADGEYLYIQNPAGGWLQATRQK